MIRLNDAKPRLPVCAPSPSPKLRPLCLAVRALLASGALLGVSAQHAGAAPALPLPKPEAAFATLGTATYTQDGVRGVIHQTSPTAILNWKSFDIGPQNSVEFKQPAETSIALNRINERANPSQILGELKANGQVYLYNPNGFVFGKHSRVNVNSLVATTLDVSDEAFERGVSKVFDQTKGQAAFQWTGKAYDVDHIGTDGKPTRIQARDKPDGTGIQIEAGAQITTNAPNRRILLVAPAVENQGTVRADDGEVIMAAATDKLYLQEAPATASVSGLLVEVGTGGAVNNAGAIASRRGSITLAGFAVNQNGLVSATTSVRQNGTIRLLAREGGRVTTDTADSTKVKLEPGSTYRAADGGDGLGQIARVTLGPDSVTQVLPEHGDKTVAFDEQAPVRSKIEIMGKQVRLESNAQVLAPSGDVAVTGRGLHDAAADPAPRDTRIDMASNSKIDVSGVKGVSLPMERNVVEVELRGNELRDAPLQRNGVLRNQKVYVDVRKGTPLADITGALQRIGRTIKERSATGGNVTLEARGAVVVNKGAVIDLSGGSVDYQGGYIKSTQLISNRRLVDISQASPDLIYERIFTGLVEKTYAKWNQTRTWLVPFPSQSRFEPGYTEGKAAGSLSVLTEALKLDGMVNAVTQRGIHQRTAQEMPEGGSLTIDLTAKSDSGFVGQDVLIAAAKPASASLGPDEVFPGLEESSASPAPLVLGGGFQRQSGISRATIKTTGRVDTRKGTLVAVPEAGALSLTGGSIKLDHATLDAPGGQVSLRTEVVSDAAKAKLDGGIELTEGSRIDVGGTWVNDRTQPGRPADYSQLAIIDAGSITLSSQADTKILPGSELAADGGAWQQQSGKLVYGKGGTISLESRAIPGLVPGVDASNLGLEGSVHAYSLDQGGSLSLTTNEILIGKADSKNTDKRIVPLQLDSGFFATGGFGRYSLTSNFFGVTVGADTAIPLRVENLELTGDYPRAPSSRSLAAITRRTTFPVFLRKPVDLTLALRPPLGQLKVNSGVTLEAGSSIETDPKGHISILSEGNIDLAGTVKAPAGSIALTILAPSDAENGLGFMPSQGIFLADSATLDARGVAILKPDRFGLKTGELLPGGAVNLRAERGYIIAAEGSNIDVSGAKDRFNLPSSLRRGVAENTTANLDADPAKPLLRVAPAVQSRQTTAVASNGGTVSLVSAEGILLDGGLASHAGGATATGGSLSVELDKELRKPPTLAPFPAGDRVIELAARDTAGVPPDWSPGKDIPLELNGLGQLAADTVKHGGFESLTLKSNDQIRFQDSLALDLKRSVVLDAPVLAWGGDEAGTAHLGAGYVAAGSSLNRHALKPATAGNGTFEMTGDLIDLFGATSLQGFADTRFTSQGDLRFRGVAPDISKEASYSGELKSAGNLTLQATQLYPTTASVYAVNLTGADSTLRIQSTTGTKSAVLSAGGDLTLSAADIVQAGDLKAPFGALHLNASRSISLMPGSATSVSGKGLLVPFGRTPGGLDWLYPLVAINSLGTVVSGDINLVFKAPPEKAIELNAPAIALNAGATVNISGGGDLGAFEFLQGLGGSIDVLDPRDPKVLSGQYPLVEKYAVLPSLKGGFAPYDPIEFTSYVGTPSGLKVGDSVYLAGGGGLAAGEYPLLPAHYALMPGAFLVTPTQGNLLPGQQLYPTDGSTVQAGYRKSAGSTENPGTWSAFAVEPGAAARKYSEYQEQRASVFFDRQAAKEDTVADSSVNDAGRLAVAVTQDLRLEANILAASANGGRGGLLDVAAPHISIVSQRGGTHTDGSVELEAGYLNRLGMESLVLGGIRSRDTAGTHLGTYVNAKGAVVQKPMADTVTVESGAHLSAPEIILTAKDQVSIQGGAEVAGIGKPPKTTANYLLDGDAALLRVASGPQAGYVHGGLEDSKGDLLIQPGAVLRAAGSMLLDSSRNTVIDGSLAMAGGDLSIYANLINLGQTPAGTGGTALSNTLLGALDVDRLALTGRSGINIYGGLDLRQGSLMLDAPVFAGFNNPEARISAESIYLANSSGKTPAKPVAGSGSLTLNAENLEFGPGSYAITGFGSVSLQGTADTRFSGKGSLNVAAATRLATARISGADGADFTLDATGFALSVDPAKGEPSLQPGLGTHFKALADRMDIGTHFDLPSGLANFKAIQGDLNLLPSAQIDLTGLNVDFGGGSVATSGGLLTLEAKAGNINLATGSTVKVAGAEGASAGGISIAAPNGSALLNGKLTASGGGGLSVDAQDFGAGGFSGLNALARSGGFDGSLSVRQRSGGLAVGAGEQVRAHHVALTADGGGIQMDGTIDARGADPGEVTLSAEGQVVLGSGSAILATATAGKGGHVELASNKAVAASNDAQGLVLKEGSTIDVSGTEGGGEIHLRAQRSNDAVSIAPIHGTLTGTDSVIAEAVKAENVTALSQSLIATWKDDTAKFMTHSAAIATGLGGGVKVLPGLEIRSTGDLALNQDWDLSPWRYAVAGESLPGFLTLRAGGNLTLNQTVSDGFDGVDPNSALRTDKSWSLRLTSGADFGTSAADPRWSPDWRQTRADTGNLTLAPGALLRTGTGDIDIHAGGNVTLKHQTAAIYTAGRKDAANPYGTLSSDFIDNYFQGLEFPIEGGAIHISAYGNIIGAASTQFIPDWQKRMGSFQRVGEAERERATDWSIIPNVGEEEMPTAWAIQYDFQQNVGTLGGGDVSLSAGGDIRNLQVMLPTSGKQVGRVNTAVELSFASYLGLYTTNEVEVNGGGKLKVAAQGDILGGQYYVGKGTANITSFGNITGGTAKDIQFKAGPLFAIGDADVHVAAAQNISVGAVYNPFALSQRSTAWINSSPSTFIGYTDDSALRLSAMAGGIDFRNDIDGLAAQYLENGSSVISLLSQQEALKLLPGTLEATAVQGSILLRSFNLFPTPAGKLGLVAGGDIQSDAAPAEVVVNMSDADPALFPSQTYPTRELSSLLTLLNTREPDPLRLPKTPLHLDDPGYAYLISRDGDINGNGNLKIFLPKPAIVSAGKDVLDIGLNLQNMRPQDVSLIQTGRDLRYHIHRGSLGDLKVLQGFGVQVQGPGQLHVLAGRDIDLGASDGITTAGNLFNPALDEIGASLSLLAGLKSKPDYKAFLDGYLGSTGGYRLDGMVNEHLLNGEIKDARDLTEDQQRELALLVLFNELKLSSQEAAAGHGYQRGNQAISTLFPEDGGYSGDIKLFFSRIHTLDGGNIDLLVPGGLINAGLASAFVGEKKSSELGVVTQRGGAVLSYTLGDFQVNQSRVFAIASGPADFTPRFQLVEAGKNIEPYKDIIAWSAHGSIDAGRGSKGALSVSGGKKGFDQQGNLTEDVPPTIDGSGIRAQIQGNNDPGNVYLVAPQGVVDAGEAGIGGSQVTIAATAIVGASNIQTGAGGLSSNVATSAPPAVVAPAAASSAAAAASQMAQQSSADSASKNPGAEAAAKPGSIKLSSVTAELVGVGEYSVNDIREGKHQGSTSGPETAKEKPAEEDGKGKKKPGF